jgi:hypothetical protein
VARLVDRGKYFRVACKSILWRRESRGCSGSKDGRLKTQNSKLKTQNSKLKTQNSKLPSSQGRIDFLNVSPFRAIHG